jgi:two-component system, OmpR family, response regulator
MRLLIVEDDAYLAHSLTAALEEQAHSTEVVKDGSEADLVLANDQFDLVVLDLNLPYLDGVEVLRRMRARGKTTPVLILSARDSVEDRVSGLNNGANDYLVKPFALSEFEARVRALLRKDRFQNLLELRYGNVSFDTRTKEVHVGETLIELTARELALLEILISKAGMLVTKRELLTSLSNQDLELTVNALDIVIHRLRKKLHASNCQIQNVRGIGYRMLGTALAQ